MARTLLGAVLAAACLALAGCQAGLQGARRQLDDTVQLPARLYGGVDRVPVTLPTLGELVDRAPGERQIRATVEGTERQYENVVAGME